MKLLGKLDQKIIYSACEWEVVSDSLQILKLYTKEKQFCFWLSFHLSSEAAEQVSDVYCPESLSHYKSEGFLYVQLEENFINDLILR